jgi:hypothetical protein
MCNVNALYPNEQNYKKASRNALLLLYKVFSPHSPGPELKGNMGKLTYNEMVIRENGNEVYLTAEGKLAIYFRAMKN